MSRKLKGLLLLPLAVLLIKALPWSPQEIWGAGTARFDDFREDSRALASGEYQERIAGAWREEAKAVRAAARAQPADEMQRELLEARQQLLDERAAALDHHTEQLLKGDVDSLKRQVVDNARKSGGGY